MVEHGGSSVSSYLANPTSPIPSHCTSIVTTSTLRVNDKLPRYYISASITTVVKVPNMVVVRVLLMMLLGLKR